MIESSETEIRACKNCACYAEIALSPLAPPQPQCRRNGPVPAQMRVERPRLDAKGQATIGKDGKPITTATVEHVMLYAPTTPESVCFDGWQPIGMRPGELSVARLKMLAALTPDDD